MLLLVSKAARNGGDAIVRATTPPLARCSVRAAPGGEWTAGRPAGLRKNLHDACCAEVSAGKGWDSATAGEKCCFTGWLALTAGRLLGLQ